MRLAVLCALPLSIAAFAAPAASQTPLGYEVAKLVTSDGAPQDLAGWAVAASGNIAVVGVPNDDIGANTDQGSAWVFRWNGSAWVEQQKLVDDEGQAEDGFGTAVAVAGDVIVVGAPGDTIGASLHQGSAHVFRSQGGVWVKEQRLVAGDGQPIDLFGSAVAVDGDTAVVGAPRDDIGTKSFQGSAYVFRWDGSTWTEEQKLVASDGGTSDYFGDALDVSGNVVVVGLYRDDIGSVSGAGSAYVFRRHGSTWTQEQKLVANDAQDSDFFGYSVATSGDLIGAGAYNHDNPGTAEGAAYLFRWNGTAWLGEQKLVPSDGGHFDEFGSALDMSGDVVVVGARYSSLVGGNQGLAYVFRWIGSAWVEEQELVPSDGVGGGYAFAFSVAVSGDLAVVGAPFAGIGASDQQGAAFAFDLLGGAWTWLGQALAGTGGFPVLSAFGDLSPGSAVSFALTQARPDAAAYLVLGLSDLSAPFKGGVLVPAPDVVLAGLATDGDGALALADTWPAGVPSGFTFRAQTWIADPVGLAGFAASNAVAGTAP